MPTLQSRPDYGCTAGRVELLLLRVEGLARQRKRDTNNPPVGLALRAGR